MIPNEIVKINSDNYIYKVLDRIAHLKEWRKLNRMDDELYEASIKPSIVLGDVVGEKDNVTK